MWKNRVSPNHVALSNVTTAQAAYRGAGIHEELSLTLSDVAQEQRMLHVQAQLAPWPWSRDKVEFKPMRVYHLYNDRKEAGNSEYSYRTTTDPPSICSVPATDSRSHSESDTTRPVQHGLNHSQTLLIYGQDLPQHQAQYITQKPELETQTQRLNGKLLWTS